MTKILYDEWQPVIGLEIHVQLKTRSKLFSSAPNAFGAEPNTNIGVVDTGQPGTLPVLNREAVTKAVTFGCAIQSDIALFSKFDRKSYFYPDSPRNFQITQFDMPLIRGGFITADVEGRTKRFDIDRAHLEDDAGMLKHFSSFAGIDYNRAGVPLLEIVSKPCIHSPKEASAYAMAIRSLLQYLDVSDCNMEEGSLRMDTNISVRRKGETGLRNKIEIKNLNSFANMEMAIELEIHRQVAAYSAHPYLDPKEVIQSGTYRLDLEKKETVKMRAKEEAMDYRYFPEPDLPPLVLTKHAIDEIKKNLPELPHERFLRYTSSLHLSEYAATTLINDKPLCEYFEQALKTTPHAASLCNWLTVEFVGRLKESGKTLLSLGIRPEHIASLVNMIHNQTITGKIAKSIADEMVLSPKDPEAIMKSNPDYQPLSDASQIESYVNEVLLANPQTIRDFKAGKAKAFNHLFGEVMKLCKGKATPDLVKELIYSKINSLNI